MIFRYPSVPGPDGRITDLNYPPRGPTFYPLNTTDDDPIGNPDIPYFPDPGDGGDLPAVIFDVEPNEQYLDCYNSGGSEWATAPYVSQAFFQSSADAFGNNINTKNTDIFNVPDTADTKLYLGVVSQSGNPENATVAAVVSVSECKTQLSNVILGCDTTSSARKFGGVSTTGVLAWVSGITGTRAAFKDPNAPWSCAPLVNPEYQERQRRRRVAGVSNRSGLGQSRQCNTHATECCPHTRWYK